MSEKLVLIDGHSILNRAFFGLPDLTNSEGLHTNAVYGFLNILFKILEEEHPDYLTRNEYGTLLLDSFDRLRNELPLGYALFHLPWVLEWYKANRQYKKACELLEAHFPEKSL